MRKRPNTSKGIRPLVDQMRAFTSEYDGHASRITLILKDRSTCQYGHRHHCNRNTHPIFVLRPLLPISVRRTEIDPPMEAMKGNSRLHFLNSTAPEAVTDIAL